MGSKNNVFSSEIGPGFGEPGGIPPRKIPRSTPRVFSPRIWEGPFSKVNILGTRLES